MENYFFEIIVVIAAVINCISCFPLIYKKIKTFFLVEKILKEVAVHSPLAFLFGSKNVRKSLLKWQDDLYLKKPEGLTLIVNKLLSAIKGYRDDCFILPYFSSEAIFFKVFIDKKLVETVVSEQHDGLTCTYSTVSPVKLPRDSFLVLL